MPPRKKTIVKTVRKVKSSTPSTVVSASSAAESDLTRSQGETSLATDSALSKPREPEPDNEPVPKASRKPETTSEESDMAVPMASKSASGETPEATEEKPTESTSVEPSAKSSIRTVIRVKKVVKKKIVKRLVPKGSIAAKKMDAEPLQDGNLSRRGYIEKDVNPSYAQCSIGQQDSTDKTLASNSHQQPEQDNIVGEPGTDAAEKLEGKSEDNLVVKEECGQVEAKYDIFEGRKEDNQLEAAVVKDQDVMASSERMKRRKTEIFIGGLVKDAKEEDLRSVFGKVGEILEVRLMMDGQTGKNKGYAFLRYAEPSQAKRAVVEFAKVEICGKVSGAAAVQGNDTIFLGNIDKKWKKEDVIKLLTVLEIENIDTVTVMMDPNNIDSNRGFAFLELESNRDAQRAYKKLQKKDAFGKGRNIKVAWAESFNVPDEEEMQKVKSVYAEGIPDSWDEGKLKESFKKFGEIERIVLGRNIKSAKRRDIAFVNYRTREAALSCIQSFNSEELTDSGLKVNLKVALAKRIQKVNPNKSGEKSTISYPLNEKHKPVQRLASQDCSPAVIGAKRSFSALGDDFLYSDLRRHSRTRLDNNIGVSSYHMMPHGMVGSSLSHYSHQPLSAGYSTTGSFYQSGSYGDTYQTRQGVPPYTSSIYHKYQI